MGHLSNDFLYAASSLLQRFVTLHRSGYATINRIYSRLFDPCDIYDELK